MVAFIFPGQGAQYVGMGKDLYEAFEESKEIFDEADKALGFSLSKLCFDGPMQELMRTVNCQPAILTTSIACLAAFRKRVADKQGIIPNYLAGLSLGEYTALVAARAISFKEGILLVANRARFMDEAAVKRSGKMSSILGLSLDLVEKVVQEAGVEIANLNCPGQVVISGSPEAIDRANSLAVEKGAKRTITLEVSGAFHCSFMQSAGEKLQGAVQQADVKKPDTPVVSNVLAVPEVDPEQIRGNLIKQLTCSVFWEKSVRYMIGQGVSRFFEIGPGRVLKGLIRKIDPGVEVVNIGNREDIDKLSG